MLFSANAILPKKKKVPEVENPSKKKKKKRMWKTTDQLHAYYCYGKS